MEQGAPDPKELAHRIKSWALEEGFQRAGISSLEPSEHGAALRDWLSRGDHAGMAWIERSTERRLRPASALPGARSALIVALHYYPLVGEAEASGDLWTGVARYARGRDYHDLMEERLRRLEGRITREFPGTRSRRYSDTGPLLERELAARAGLGAVGKHTNLLHPDHGSWFLLGELLLSLDLPADSPVAEPCGSCSRCLSACPTGALPEAYRLDSRRCISYWTIEHRGALPIEVRPLLGDWVFGCDICQEACPWNRQPPPADEPDLRLPARRADLDLVALLRLPVEAYAERFRGSPMKRARREGLQRNAAVAMGNRRDPGHIPALRDALEDPSDTVRSHAAWALGRIGGPDAQAALASALTREEDGRVREEIETALGASGASQARI